MADFPYMLQSRISEKMEQMPFLLLCTDEQSLLPELYKAVAGHYSRTAHSSYREILRSLLLSLPRKYAPIYSGILLSTPDSSALRQSIWQKSFGKLPDMSPQEYRLRQGKMKNRQEIYPVGLYFQSFCSVWE